MTDTNTSGADFAPGAGPSLTDSQAPAASAATGAFGATQPIGAFGSVRGSGLARGKRTSTPAATAAPAAKTGEYKPTALEVIIPEREYKNPFTGETSVNPPAEAPAEAQPSAREYITPQPPQAEAPAPGIEHAPIVERDAAHDEAPSQERPELTILPPARPVQAAQSWERSPSTDSKSAEPIFPLQQPREGRRDDRSDSRPEPRADGREPRSDGRERRRDERTPREGQRRDDSDSRYGRQHPDPRDYPDGNEPRWGRESFRRREPSAEAPRPETPKKPAGFFGWLKSLFGDKPAAQPHSGEGDRGQGLGHDGQHHRGRRRRGGRGRSRGEFRGGEGFNADRAGQGQSSPEGGQPRFQGGESRGDYPGGEHRRHRGGRGRHRDDRGGPRSEGSQGGGAI